MMINVKYAKTSRFNQCQSCLSALNCMEILIGANENQLMRFVLCELCVEIIRQKTKCLGQRALWESTPMSMVDLVQSS